MVLTWAILFALYAIMWGLILGVLATSIRSELGIFEAAAFTLKEIFKIVPLYVAKTLDWAGYPFTFAWEFAKHDHPLIAFAIWFILLMLVAEKTRFQN